jgi:hypothetical protein
MTNEVPSDAEVVATLQELGDRITARDLCIKLIAAGHPKRQSQLAIQRAAERGKITVNSDWSLSVTVEEALAA